MQLHGEPPHSRESNCIATSFYDYVHSSKFTPHGSARIFSSVMDSSLECVAFLTPTSDVVVVVLNMGDESVTFKLLE